MTANKPREFNIGVISEYPFQIKILQSDYDHTPEELASLGCCKKIKAVEKSYADALEKEHRRQILALGKKMLDYEKENASLRKAVLGLADTLKSISIMKEGFEEDNYQAIELSDDALAEHADLIKRLKGEL